VRATSGQTLQSLLALLNGLSRMEGRKNVLLMSEGFLAEESWPLVQQTVGQASRANARIYTLDARGLDRGLRSGQDVDPGANDSIGRLLAQFDMGADPINSLAVDTGGFVVRNTNYFDKAIEQVVQDAGNYYVLGYRPEVQADGNFRRVSVKVNRPGLTVRARRGYVASPRTPAVTSATARATSPVATPAAATPAAAAAALQRTGTNSAETPAAGPGATPPLAETAPAPAAADAVVARGPSTSGGGVRLRPDASRHVETLATAAAPDLDAHTGWEAYGRGDLESARQSLAAAALRPSARPWVHYALGQSEYALRHYPEATSEWEKVRATVPEFEPVYFDLVDGYIQIQDRDKAIRVLRAAKERWPHDAEVFNALGVVQVSRGSLDDAVASFRLAIDAAPNEPVGYFNLGKTLELRYSRSRRYVQQTRTWVANETDRTNAISNYEHYLTLGGPLENSAREGLNRLAWARQP
jgi:tetratricopeptide (TPR) repeat protein